MKSIGEPMGNCQYPMERYMGQEEDRNDSVSKEGSAKVKMTEICKDHKSLENVKLIGVDKSYNVRAECTLCKAKLATRLENFPDYHNLLHYFSEDVCSGCANVVNCWSEGMIMPNPTFMKRFCKRGIWRIFEERAGKIQGKQK